MSFGSAKPFIYKLVFHANETHFHKKKKLCEDSFWNIGERQFVNDQFALAFGLYYRVKWLAYENSRHFVLQSEVKRNMENLGLSLAPEGSFISIQTRWDNI